MTSKFVVLSALVVLARAGAIGVASPAISYASSPAISYAAPALAQPISYSAPVAYSSPVVHAAPAISYAAPAPVAHAVAAPVAVNSYSVPNYDFAYGVNDPHTGDVKNQQESRHGDVVQGSYSLIDSDGTRRVVQYSADPINGFNAVVHKEPIAVAAAPVSTVAAAPGVSLGYSGLGYSRALLH